MSPLTGSVGVFGRLRRAGPTPRAALEPPPVWEPTSRSEQQRGTLPRCRRPRRIRRPRPTSNACLALVPPKAAGGLTATRIRIPAKLLRTEPAEHLAGVRRCRSPGSGGLEEERTRHDLACVRSGHGNKTRKGGWVRLVGTCFRPFLNLCLLALCVCAGGAGALYAHWRKSRGWGLGVGVRGLPHRPPRYRRHRRHCHPQSSEATPFFGFWKNNDSLKSRNTIFKFPIWGAPQECTE